MVISEMTKNAIVHTLRTISYVTFPIGTFLLSYCLLSTIGAWGTLTTSDSFWDVSASSIFLIQLGVILFLHPIKLDLASNIAKTSTARIKYYSTPNQYLIICILAVVGITPLLLLLIFMVVAGA